MRHHNRRRRWRTDCAAAHRESNCYRENAHNYCPNLSYAYSTLALPTRLVPQFHGATAMKVEITTPPGIFAEGLLKAVVSEQGASYPHIVIEMSVTGVSDPVKVTLDEHDLSTIIRLARASTVQRIRDAVT